jgi:hypothetical protein
VSIASLILEVIYNKILFIYARKIYQRKKKIKNNLSLKINLYFYLIKSFFLKKNTHYLKNNSFLISTTMLSIISWKKN